MKLFIRRTLWLAVLAALTQWNGTASAQTVYSEDGDFSVGGTEQHAVLTIKADGSCQFVTETIESRTAAEQQVRLMERFRKMSEAGDERAGAAEVESSSTNAPTPFTDEELSKRLTDMTNERADESGGTADQKFNVEVKKTPCSSPPPVRLPPLKNC
jgi:hypothetical protein